MGNRLEILKTSLAKKQQKFDDALQKHYADVKSANGQPLNDKRNGRSTMARWEKQDNALRNLQLDIEKTKAAIEKEEYKIGNVNKTNDVLPKSILKFIEDGVLTQWRKYPNRFFVVGVEKGRIIYDQKNNKLMYSYFSEIPTEEQRDIFRNVAKSLLSELEKETH